MMAYTCRLLLLIVLVAATGKTCSSSGLKSESFYDGYATILTNVLASLDTPEGRVVLGNLAKDFAEKGTMAAEKSAAAIIGLAEKSIGSLEEEFKGELVNKVAYILQVAVKEQMKRYPMLGDAVNLITFIRDVTAKEISKKTAEWVPSSVVSTSKKLIRKAKTTVFIGVAIEGASLAYTGYSSYKKMQEGEISWVEFRQHMVTSTVGAGGSVTGSTVGAAIGSIIIPVPVVGGVVGGIVGGVFGRYVGKQGGEQFDKLAFDQQC